MHRQSPIIQASAEYETLRGELLQAKHYVFERPLVIAGLAFAGAQFMDKPIYRALPAAIAVLTLFNFWFTVNRLTSAARIAAYIQLELEERRYGQWVGWESCLRYYRKWLRAHPNASAMVDARLEPDFIPDALMYYPPIYFLHMALMVASIAVALVAWSRLPGLTTTAAAAVSILLGAWSIRYFYIWRPGRLRAAIERNRVIWIGVFEFMQANGVK